MYKKRGEGEGKGFLDVGPPTGPGTEGALLRWRSAGWGGRQVAFGLCLGQFLWSQQDVDTEIEPWGGHEGVFSILRVGELIMEE